MSNLKNGRILLTGGAGYSGSDFIEKLLQWGLWRKTEVQIKRCLEVRKAETESGFIAETPWREGLNGTIQAYKKTTNPDIS
jgi:hypothetical protein